MIKRFCDGCGNEILEDNKLKYGQLEIDVLKDPSPLRVQILPLTPQEADLDVCKYCVLDALTKLDDRPREAKEYDQKRTSRI